MKNKFITILRWIALLPSACAAYAITYFLIMLLRKVLIDWYFGDSDTAGSYLQYIVPFIAGFAAGASYMYAGAQIAPSHKKITAIVLLVILCLVTGGGMIICVQDGTYASVIAPSIAQILAAAFSCFAVEEEEF